jgi:hypothetical protein
MYKIFSEAEINEVSRNDTMNSNIHLRKVGIMGYIAPFLIGLFLPPLFIAGCSSGLRVQLPKDMVPFKDSAKKMEFQLPAGWERAPVDPVIESNTKEIRKSAPIGFRKADKGTLAVWCNRYDSTRSQTLHMIDVLNAYAPIHDRAEFEVDVETPTKPGGCLFFRTRVDGFRSTNVVKGEKKNFMIFTVISECPGIETNGCDYILFGRSSSDEYSEEIKKDITAISATLINRGD